jgi:hypothetical protein
MKRYALTAAAALLFAGAAHAQVTEFVIYKQPDFKGPQQVIKGEVNILENGFAREGESLVVRGGYWEACTEDRFKGSCRVYDPGQYARLGDFSRRIVSVRFLGTDRNVAKREADRIAANERAALHNDRQERDSRDDRGRYRHGSLELFGREGFNGRSIHVDDNVPDLYARRFDGRASSLIVHEGTWQLCSRQDFEGQCRTFGPGEYPRLAGLDDRVTSIRQIR